MKTIARITGVAKSDVGDSVFADLLQIHPGGARRYHFTCILPFDDPRAIKVMERLTLAGFSPWENDLKKRKPNEYSFRLEHEYDDADFEKCHYVELQPLAEAYCGGINRGPSDREEMLILGQYVPEEQFDFLGGDSQWHFVPTRVKSLLASGGFTGLKFGPTFYVPPNPTEEDTPERLRAKYGIPYWEIDSDLTMPPLSPSMTFVNNEGTPVKSGDNSNGFFRLDGLYLHPELHYRESDLRDLGDVDIARTREAFSNYREYNRLDCPLIVSKRFYDFCVKNGLKASWVPVRIDP